MNVENRAKNYSYSAVQRQDLTSPGDAGKNELKLKRELGLLSSTAYVVGGVIGFGIFVAPKSVLQYSGSIGYSLVFWAVAGLFSLIGCLCYVELGLTFPKSGGAYIYVKEAFGDISSFIYLWVETIIRRPTALALMGISFAKYVIQPFYEGNIPLASERLIAACLISVVTFVNCLQVRWGVSVQIIMTATKLSALLIIIILGIIMLGKGHTQNFNTAFEKSPDTAADVVFALYAGLWAYSGWDSINFAVEEVKNPYKLIPRTIYLSIFIITSIYLLTNVAYMAVLTGEEILQDHTVAVTFSLRTLGNYHLVVPILVGISAVGTVNALIFTSSRIFFVAAREHQLPSILAMINIKYFTPQPALILNCILALLVLVGGDFTSILNYYSFIRWATVGFSVYAQLWLRWKKPNLLRPIKFSIIVPVIFSIACTIVVVVPFYRQPVNCLIGIGLTLIAFPLYFFFLGWKKKPDCLNKSQDKFTIHCQKLLMVCPTEEEIK